MSNTTTIIVLIAAVALLILGAYLGNLLARYRRTRQFRKRFGPEYERALDKLGDKKEVEKVLAARLEHVKSLDLRPLSRDETERFTAQWRAAQARFVDEPFPAARQANRLIREVMQARGYPVDDFEQRAADISVDYPELVGDYRGLHDIAGQDAGETPNTEDLRKAMLHGRALFDNLLSARPESRSREPRKETA